MTIHELFYGGNKRNLNVAERHSRTTGWVESDHLVRYAGHLPRKHFVLPFEYDGAGEEWVKYRESVGPIETGDVLYIHSISADSRVDALVFQNKKPAGIIDENTGAVTTPAKVKLGLYDGEKLVAETDEIDLSKISRTVLEFGSAGTLKNTNKKDTNDDGKITKADMPETVITLNGAYLGNNGTIRLAVVDGSGFDAACFTAFCEVVDFLCVRTCSCAVTACESSYPDPECY